MELADYFETTRGTGILAAADSSGKVDLAVYAKPHFEDKDTVSFIMTDRLLHHHLQSNPHAAFLFMEEGRKYVGRRLFLTKIKEEEDSEKVNNIMKQYYTPWYGEYKDIKKFLVYFKVDKVLPLVGGKE